MYLLKVKNNKVRQITIRFWKKGPIFYPLYDIVVTYKDNRNKGFCLEKLGFYNPHNLEKSLFIDTFRLSYWLRKGAFVNFTVKKYIVKFLLF